MNKVILIGNVGKDPEIRTTQNNNQVAEFSLATSKKYNGETTTQWHTIVAFNKLAEVIAKYISKGSKVGIVGELQYSKYEKDGETKYFTKIITNELEFLDSKDSSNNQSNQSKPKSKSSAETIYGDEDDDVPF